MKLERIVLGTDFSDPARSAYSAAAELARKYEARLDLAHVVEWPAGYAALDHGRKDPALERLRGEALRNLQAEIDSGAFSGITLERHLLEGSGPQALCDHAAARKADLVVQGSHGRTGLRRLLLGSFAEGVVRNCTAPVLTVKRRDPAAGDSPAPGFHPRRILYPSDLSPVAACVVPVVRSLAASYASTVELFFAWQTVEDLPALSGQFLRAIEDEYVPFDGRVHLPLIRELERFAERELPGIDHDYQVVRGDPATELCSRVHRGGVDLVCMSTHGWTGLRHIVLGSVTEKVVRHIECPVLTLRAPIEALHEEAHDLTDRRERGKRGADPGGAGSAPHVPEPGP